MNRRLAAKIASVKTGVLQGLERGEVLVEHAFELLKGRRILLRCGQVILSIAAKVLSGADTRWVAAGQLKQHLLLSLRQSHLLSVNQHETNSVKSNLSEFGRTFEEPIGKTKAPIAHEIF